VGELNSFDSLATANYLTQRCDDVTQAYDFTWPHFTLANNTGPSISWESADSDSTTSSFHHPAQQPLLRDDLFRQLSRKMNYNAALGIGHLHRYLKRPLPSDKNGNISYIHLSQNLHSVPYNSLVYVCADLNQLPPGTPEKKKLVESLIKWV
jgi:hypothetical protein